MKWFKHLIESGDDPDIGGIMNGFGFRGYYLFFRVLEIMAKEFEIENPGQNTFNFQWFLGRFPRQVDKKTLLNFLDFCKNSLSKTRIDYLLKGDQIWLFCPKLKDLTDEYTAKMLGVAPDSVGIKSGVNQESVGSHRSKITDNRLQNIEHNNIISVFNLFKTINPTINYGHKTNRQSVHDLIKLFGLDKTIKMAEYAISVQGNKYAPVITTPYLLKEKLAQLKIYADGQKNKQLISFDK